MKSTAPAAASTPTTASAAYTQICHAGVMVTTRSEEEMPFTAVLLTYAYKKLTKSK